MNTKTNQTFLMSQNNANATAVNTAIDLLKSVNIDGETMEYILEELGMTDQMLRQLIIGNPESDTKDILDEKISLTNQRLATIYKDGTEVFEGDMFARKCSITGEGMNEGWVINGGNVYIKYEDDAKAYVMREWNMTMDEAYNDDEDSDGFYWTEYEDFPEDYQYKIVNGKLTDIDEL